MDEPCKDLLRREMRCKGMRRIPSQLGLEPPLEDLLSGHDQSAGFLQTFWRVNKDPSILANGDVRHSRNFAGFACRFAFAA
jgi:hypothetical protein